MGLKGGQGRVLLLVAALGGVVGTVALQGDSAPLPLLAASSPAGSYSGRSLGSLPRLSVEAGVPSSAPGSLSRRSLAGQTAPEELPVWEEPNFDGLIAALAHDNVPGNARDAYREIKACVLRSRRKPWGAEEEEASRERMADLGAAKSIYQTFAEKLALALQSTDHQQRQLAACLLLSCRRDGLPEEVPKVLVEALRYDGIEGWSCGVNNAATSVRFFAKHPERIDDVLPGLSRALTSDDGQARFLAAFILGRASRTETAPTSCPLLIEHLEDNNVHGDEEMARHSLYRMGSAALPYIRSALSYPRGKQATRLLREVEAEILEQDPTVRPRMRPPSVRVDPLRGSIIEWGDEMSRGRRYTPR